MQTQRSPDLYLDVQGLLETLIELLDERTNDIDDTAIAGPLFACHQLIATFVGLQLCLGASSHQKSEVSVPSSQNHLL